MLLRNYAKSVGIKVDNYSDEIIMELLIESHKLLYKQSRRIEKAKKKIFGKPLLKYLCVK